MVKMKNKKRLRRFILPLVLIGLGIFIGTSLAESNQPTIQLHGDIDFSGDEIEAIIGLEKLEAEMDEIVRDIQLSVPEAPASPQQPTINVYNQEESSLSSRVNVGWISGLMGGFGVLAIFIMALLTFSGDARNANHD